MRLVQAIRMLPAAAAAGMLFAGPAAAQQRAATTDPRPLSGGEVKPAQPVEQPHPPQRHTARSVAGAPRPDGAGGIARPEREPREGGRALARALLVVPRAALWIASAPIRAGVWLTDRYKIPQRMREAFFNSEGAGVVPLAWGETGFGGAGGARFFHRDLLGRGEHLVADVSYGGRLEPGAALRIDSGDRLGDRLLVRVDGRFQERPRDRFFGIGNGDQVAEVAAPVDPYADPAAVDTRFHQRLIGAGTSGEVRLIGPLAVRLSSTALWRRVDAASDEVDIAASYQTDALPGFGADRASTYSQLELGLDTRDRPARSEPPGPRATGLALSAFAGAATGPAHARFGGEARAQLPLGSRQRILVLRARAEGVTGPLDEIPFVDLPRLGGSLLLRGYPADRFRDRAMALTSAEYRFDLGESLGAFLFVDGGRVLASPADLVAGGLRAGYGGGLDLSRGEHHLGRLSLASSIDGGFIASAAFDPLGDPEGRP